MNGLAPFRVLYERDGLPRAELPGALERIYGSGLGLPEACVYTNFVSTIDGVVAIPSVRRSHRLIGDESDADLFVMALLRAFADVVLVGAGTLPAAPTARWRAETAYPAAAGELVDLRRRLGRSGPPRVAIVTASGSIELGHPAVQEGALVLTTERGAERLRDRLPGDAQPEVVAGDEDVDLRAAIELLHSHGHRRILSEGGPTLFGSLAASGLVDELFLTVSPLVAGRSQGERQLGLVEGTALLPDRRLGAELLSVRTHGSHLFLRYGLRR
jgi:5-amino-6-(5-phosphoribosylamino)uracil reductase